MIVKDPKNILLIQLGDIGDVVLTFPCIRALKETYPSANVFVAVREKAVDLAGAIDQSIGKAIHIQELDWGLRTVAQPMSANIMIRGTASQTPEPLPEIEFEKIKLEYTISAKFQLN